MRRIICLFVIYLITGSTGFLLTGMHFCVPNLFCSLQCANGLETMNGCPICRCKTTVISPDMNRQPVTGVNNQMSGFNSLQSNMMGSTLHHPCIPSQAYCRLNCAKYVTGDDGCQYCICDQDTTVTTTSPVVTKPRLVLHLSNPCVSSETTCDKSCTHGFLIGPNNCQYCICSPYDQHITTGTPTTEVVSMLQNPCAKSQKCLLRCTNGYVHGPSGCEYCYCNPDTTEATSHGVVTSAPVSNNTMSEQCVIATAICQVKCKGGFMTDKNDCTFCTCKDEIEKALHMTKTVEPVIQLMKPCVQEFNMCNIFCHHGYLRGPDNCQFCACGH